MEPFLEDIAKIKQRVQHGSTMCNQKQLPFLMFKCGLLFSRLSDINKVISFVETIEYLRVERKISQTYQGHLLLFVYQHPDMYYKASDILDRLIKNKNINVIIQLEKLEREAENNRSVNMVMVESKMVEEQRDNIGKITKTGTIVVSDSQANQVISSQLTQKLDEQQFRAIEKLNMESEALARQLQAQEEKLAKQQKIQDDTVCQICYVGLYDEEFLPLETCSHIFHKNCLSEFFKAQISQNRFPLKCPGDKCGLAATNQDIKEILSSQLYNKYEKHTLIHYADMHGDSISWCPTADCGYMFFFEKDDEVRFRCLQCGKQYCLNCRVEWHKDMNCKQFQISNTRSQADEAFQKFAKGKKYKQCPKCKLWVEKTEGCDHMTCKCKFEFCYKCGGIYMKCECVEKQRQDIERRRIQMQQRRRRKLQLLQNRKKKKAAKEEQVIPQRRTRQRKGRGRGG